MVRQTTSVWKSAMICKSLFSFDNKERGKRDLAPRHERVGIFSRAFCSPLAVSHTMPAVSLAARIAPPFRAEFFPPASRESVFLPLSFLSSQRRRGILREVRGAKWRERRGRELSDCRHLCAALSLINDGNIPPYMVTRGDPRPTRSDTARFSLLSLYINGIVAA